MSQSAPAKDVNLLPAQLRPPGPLRASARVVLAALLVFFLAAGVGYYYASLGQEMWRLAEEVRSARAAAEALAPAVSLEAQVAGLRAELEQAAAAVGLAANPVRWSTAVVSLAGILPSDAYLTVLESTGEGNRFRISGVAKSWEALSQLVRRMSSLPGWGEVSVEKAAADDAGIRFEISARLALETR